MSKPVRRDNKPMRRDGKFFRNDQGKDCCCDDNQFGACCFPYGGCGEKMTDSDCKKQGGVWQGPNTTCTPNPCPIGCCLPNGNCIDTSVADCQAQGGTMNGSSCAHATCATHCPPENPPHNCNGCPDIIVAYGYMRVKSVLCRPNAPACAGLPPFVTCEGDVTAPIQRIGCSWDLWQAQGIMTCDACQGPNPIAPRINLSAFVRCTSSGGGPAWPNPNFLVTGGLSGPTATVNCHPQNIAWCVHVCKGCELTGGPPGLDNVVAYFPPTCPPPGAGSSSSHTWNGWQCFCSGFDCGCQDAAPCEWEGSIQVG